MNPHHGQVTRRQFIKSSASASGALAFGATALAKAGDDGEPLL